MAHKFFVGQHVTAPRLGWPDDPREPGVVTHVEPYMVCVVFPSYKDIHSWGYTELGSRWHISLVLPTILKHDLEVSDDSI